MTDLHSSRFPEHTGDEPLPALRKIHESFGRNLATALSGMLRSFVEVKLAGIQQISSQDFLNHAENPTYLGILHAEPLADKFLLEINLSILFPIIDRLLGGGREPSPPLRRPLTEIEFRLAERITTVILDELRQTWKGMLDLRLTQERSENNPRAMPPLPTNANLALVQFEISLGGSHGQLNLGIPSSALERVSGKTAESSPAARAETAGGDLVPIVAELAETNISAADLARLEVGDVITTEHSADQPIVVRIDGVAQYFARPIACDGRKAIQIEGPAE